MDKILVTGTGFLAKNIAATVPCQLFTRTSKISDILDYQPDIIIHTAAELDDNEKMFESNVVLTQQLLEATKAINYRSFVYIGSSSEYGLVNEPIKEICALKPRNLYEATKGCGSLLCQAYSKIYGKNIVVARPFSLYGKHDKPRKFIPTCFRRFREDQPMSIVKNSLHDWIFVDDFIRGVLLLAYTATGFDAVNLGTGIQTTNWEVFLQIAKLFKKTIPCEEIPPKDYDSNVSWVADPSYAKNKYGFEYKYSLEEGLCRLKEES